MTLLSQSARRDRWEAATEVPLIVLGLGFIVSYSFYVLWLEMPAWLAVVVRVEMAAAWLLFLIDYIVRVSLTAHGERWLFVRRNIVDLLSVLIPLFRAIRVINLLRNVPYFRVKTGAAVRAEVLTYAGCYAALFVYFIALAALSAERDVPGATITDFGLAVWWACVTIATVGYGDTYPITALGRFYAVMLMVGGIAIIGTASAVVLSYITQRVSGHLKKDE